MKRSKINEAIREMEQLIKEHGFELPPFCKWTPKEWEEKAWNMMKFVTIC